VSIDFPTPKATLAQYDLRPKKSFGQNFLADAQLVDRIAALAGDRAHVIEIGAGLGGLTACLLNRGHRVTAIERDRDLIAVLTDVLQPALQDGSLKILEEDAKAVDVAELFAGAERRVLMGNLPYQITGPLLQNAVVTQGSLDLAVFLVQKEVADRLCAAPSSKTYGALSVFAQAAFEVTRAMIVRRGAFYPQPNVDSAVVTLTPRRPPISEETEAFRQLVQGAFRERRKVLRNSWKGVLGASRQALEAAATECGISLDARGETLSVEHFARMAVRLSRPDPGGQP